jgi:predicted transglutaminase-like cysteine proteinase
MQRDRCGESQSAGSPEGSRWKPRWLETGACRLAKAGGRRSADEMIASSHAAVPVKSIPLAGGDAGIAQTVGVMHSLIDQGAVDPGVREQALGIVRSAGTIARDAAAEISAIFYWMKAHMRFQRDVSGGEYVCAPQYLLRTMAGDCDDYVVLGSSLLKSLGIPIRIVTIAADPEEPRRLSHVYLEAQARGEWIPFDATQRDSYPGWQPPRYFRKKVWESSGLSRQAAVSSQQRAGSGTQYAGLAGLGQGDDDFATDITALTPFVAAATQGTAQIVQAANQPQYVVPASMAPGSTFSLESGVSGSISPLVLLGIAAIAVILIAKK